MDRSRALQAGLQRVGMSQAELARLTGIPQGRISLYANRKLEPTNRILHRMLDAMGLGVHWEVTEVRLDPEARRSWLIHRAIDRKLAGPIPAEAWTRMRANLDVLLAARGEPPDERLSRWGQIVDTADARELRHVLLDVTSDGIAMRELSPMDGFLTPAEERAVLDA